MKKICLSACFSAALFLSGGMAAPAMCGTQVQVNINAPLPPLVIPAPPLMIPIPEVNVYYPPEVKTEIFFYHGKWYRPHNGEWYSAGNYNGPWRIVSHRLVPSVVMRVPHAYRESAHRYEPVPYERVRRNQYTWEREHHWKGHDEEDHRGPGNSANAHDKNWHQQKHRGKK